MSELTDMINTVLLKRPTGPIATGTLVKFQWKGEELLGHVTSSIKIVNQYAYMIFSDHCGEPDCSAEFHMYSVMDDHVAVEEGGDSNV